MTVRLVADVGCALGEGPLWHPGRRELYWFDILGARLFACDAGGGGLRHWDFEETVSAAGWISRDELLVASASALLRFDLATGRSVEVCALEAGNPANRANDGRADRHGGFWIGTMGREAERGVGTIYRYAGGRLATLWSVVSIPNAICFAPDGHTAYFADSAEFRIYRVALDPETGAPVEKPQVFVDLGGTGIEPDGAVCDAQGFVWNAQWNGWRLVRYAPDGSVDRIVEVPVQRPTCPAIGGADLRTLYFTSARDGLTAAELAEQPGAGGVFAVPVEVPGLPEPCVHVPSSEEPS